MRKIRMRIMKTCESLPTYKTPSSAGCDLAANISEEIELLPGDSAIFPTGIHIALPERYEGQIRGRSGLNCNDGIVCPVGTIDADYRGELKVKLYNLSKRPYTIKPQERIAQLVICPVVQAKWDEVEFLECDTERGTCGFGHTGRF